MLTGEAQLSDFKHRVANDLSLIASVLRRQRSQLEFVTADEALDDAMGAILSLAQFYRRLYETGADDCFVALPVHLDGIACGLRTSYLDRLGIHLSCSADAISAPAPVARDIGLIVTELVGNAAKHAFGRTGGRIAVDLVDCDRGLVCRVSDDGTGVSPEVMLRTGGGLSGASRLAAALGGWVETGRNATGGAAFELVIPRPPRH